MSYVVRSKAAKKRFLREPGGHMGCAFRDAHRFRKLEDAQVEADRYVSWREVVRVTYVRKVRRVARLKVVT